ncbi:MAG: cobyrinate a,c-diamide synthase [Bacteroidales bacterium]|nr:cobyrinate a,c-diamide synthase [Bacteroidales bacterium]
MSAHERRIPQFLIAAPSSGSGKTTVCVGLMETLAHKGLKVQPFKCGPDYIDTKFHEKACGRPSVNLDSFFAERNHIRQIYRRFSTGADICVVEGMMGLFDGFQRAKGSTGEIASILRIPVVLVVDAKSTAYSLAPLLKGFKEFSPDVSIIGVIFNKIGSQKHRQMLEEVCADCGLESFGFIPKKIEADNPSRYLGLDFSAMNTSAAANLVAEHIDIERLLESALKHSPDLAAFPVPEARPDCSHNVLVARNKESFSFIYQEHVAGWQNVEFFDPEKDVEIPQGIDLLYLPGGYPEKHLETLSKCRKTMDSIRNYAQAGGKILAECGGMMYLCQSILSDEGEYPMCGVLPYRISSRKEDRKLHLGYRSFTYNGLNLKGHEFHYTKFLDPQPESVAKVFDARGNKTDTPIIRTGNTIASYTHLYWGVEDIFKLF